MLKLSNGESISQEHLRAVSQIVDKDNNGISILELLEAFCFEDSGGTAMPNSLAEHIIAVLFRHRMAVRTGARVFDKCSTGFIAKEDFQKVLVALNSATGDVEQMLEPQIFTL